MKEILNLSLRLALICAVMAVVLSKVDAMTREPIAAVEALAQREAVEAVMPPFETLEPDTLADGGIYFVGRGPDGPTGYAFAATSAKAYSGEIAVMVGVDAGGRVQGVRVLRHAETPGLGSRYADAEVLKSFYAGHGLHDRDWRVKKDGGDVDAITGATVTGRALAEAVSTGLAGFERDRPQMHGASPAAAAADTTGEAR